jgi:MFS family permease
MVLTGRLMQGFSAGAEMGGVSVYLFEIAPAGQKGFYVAWQSVSQNVAVVFAAILGVALRFRLTTAQMNAWGWRIPFFIGSLIVPVLFVIRRRLRETEFFATQKHPPTFRQILQSVVQNWKIIGKAVMLVTLTPVMFYMLTAYIPTFGPRVLKLSYMHSFLISLCVGLSNIIWVPIGAALSDRVGRRRVLSISAFLIMVLAYPGMLYVVHHPSFGHFLGIVLGLAFIYGGFQGAVVVTLTETMPANIRSTGFSVVWSVAQAIFGGFTPAICTYLIHRTGNSAMPGAWLALAAGIALCGTLLLVPRATAPALSAKAADAN